MSHRIAAQRFGGHHLAIIKNKLVALAKPGTSFEYIEQQADKLIAEAGCESSFKKVRGYHWSTCINVNDGFVHGIPKGVFHEGDLATIDVGIFYKGYHTDTSTSFIVGKPNSEKANFLEAGRLTLPKAVAQAIAGNYVWDISHVIQTEIEAQGFSVARNLTGHGVGKRLHEDPPVPCYIDSPRESTPILKSGQALAIEVMYCQGHWRTITDPDGWTIRTADGKLSAVFEDTVIVRPGEPEMITSL